MTGMAAGQAAVEAGLGAARAGTTTAPAKSIGKAMSGLADRLDKAVKAGRQDSGGLPAGTAAARSTARTQSASANNAPPPASNWEDPSDIPIGLTYQELVRRFGPPAMEITGESGKSLTYSVKPGLFNSESWRTR